MLYFISKTIYSPSSRLSDNVMAQHFHYMFRRAGIPGASSHSMRRTFITTRFD